MAACCAGVALSHASFKDNQSVCTLLNFIWSAGEADEYNDATRCVNCARFATAAGTGLPASLDKNSNMAMYELTTLARSGGVPSATIWWCFLHSATSVLPVAALADVSACHAAINCGSIKLRKSSLSAVEWLCTHAMTVFISFTTACEPAGSLDISVVIPSLMACTPAESSLKPSDHSTNARVSVTAWSTVAADAGAYAGATKRTKTMLQSDNQRMVMPLWDESWRYILSASMSLIL